MMNHTDLAQRGEAFVYRLLSRLKLDVEWGGPADLLVNDVPLEVKAAQPRPYRDDDRLGYQFCLYRDGGKTSIQAPVVVLLCYWREEHQPMAFIVPSAELGDRKKVAITSVDPSEYSGQWSEFYERWEILADHLE